MNERPCLGAAPRTDDGQWGLLDSTARLNSNAQKTALLRLNWPICAGEKRAYYNVCTLRSPPFLGHHSFDVLRKG
jgi:hypothetical protein